MSAVRTAPRTGGRPRRLDRTIARLLLTAVWVSSLLVAAGVALWWTPWSGAAKPLVTAGIAVVVAAPALRLVVMAAFYVRSRDRTHLLVTLTVLAVVAVTAAVGALG